MKNILLFSSIVSAFALFAACGDDSSSGPEEESSSSIEAEDYSSSSEAKCSSSLVMNSSSSRNDITGSSSSWSHLESSTESGDEEPGSSSAMSSSTAIENPESSSSEEESSSSEKESSSSAEESSSSEAVAEVMPSGTYNCDTYNCVDTTYLKKDFIYGEILDTRDDRVYKVATIGEGDNAQIWMAQNLNYKLNDESDTEIQGRGVCYGGNEKTCDKYGRLYSWVAAMNVTEDDCGYGHDCGMAENIRGVCPNGWHLPSKMEWESLFKTVGGKEIAGVALKATEGWPFISESSKGADTYGFAVLPAGYNDSDGDHGAGEEGSAYFWSSSETNANKTFCVHLYFSYAYVSKYDYSKNNAFSVRCIRDKK